MKDASVIWSNGIHCKNEYLYLKRIQNFCTIRILNVNCYCYMILTVEGRLETGRNESLYKLVNCLLLVFFWELIFIYCRLFLFFFFILVVFVLFLLSLSFGQNFTYGLLQVILPRPRIGMLSLVTVSPVITAFHSRCLSHHVFDQVNLWPAWVGFETAIFWQCSPGTAETQRQYPLRHGPRFLLSRGFVEVI